MSGLALASLLQLLSLEGNAPYGSFCLFLFDKNAIPSFFLFLISSSFIRSSRTYTMFHSQDPIAPHSDSLCQVFNQEHPSTVLTVLRFVAKNQNVVTHEDPIVSAKAVQVNQYGLTIDGQTTTGKHVQATVSFSSPVHSLSQVTQSFLNLGKKAEQSLSPSPRESRKVRKKIIPNGSIAARTNCWWHTQKKKKKKKKRESR